MKFDRLIKSFAVTSMLAGALVSAYAKEDPAVAESSSAAAIAGNPPPPKACASGYFPVGPTLCMTGALGPDSFANALAVCQSLSGKVAGYGDWRYRILFGDGVAAPQEWWLGPITADDRALFVNSTNVGNFDGETSRFEIRSYACSKG
jgi:hypothetical protein